MTSNNNARLPRNKHFILIFVDVNVIIFLAEWRQRERKTKWHLRMCTVLSKRLFHYFSGVVDSFHGIIQNARITIKHVSFNALRFAESLRRCLNTHPAASCSNSFLRTRQMLMHEKNMCDPYILRRTKSTIISWHGSILFPYLLFHEPDEGHRSYYPWHWSVLTNSGFLLRLGGHYLSLFPCKDKEKVLNRNQMSWLKN